MPRLSHAVAATALAALAAPTATVAQVGAVYQVIIPQGEFGSQQFTDYLVGGLSSARAFCGQLDAAYRVDCLSERIANMANDIPADTDYDEVRSVLNSASAKLNTLVRQNRDAGRPRQSARSGGETPQATTRPLAPIQAAAQATVNAQALAILEESETILLRSPADQTGKRLQYARIADALGSNKALLRST